MIEQMKQYNSLVAKLNLSDIFFQREKNEAKIEKAYQRYQQIMKSLQALETWFETEKIEVSGNERAEGFNIEYREQRMNVYKF